MFAPKSYQPLLAVKWEIPETIVRWHVGASMRRTNVHELSAFGKY